jgi:hypothetical protein
MKSQSTVSEQLKNIADTYEKIKTAIAVKLGSTYKIIDEQYHPEAFGSRYVIWSNEQNAIRFIWDGKDEWFFLEKAHTPPFDWKSDWKEITHIPYLRQDDLEYASSLPGKITSSLN